MKKNNSPIYHHIIPQCYMKNFGVEIKQGKYNTGYLYWPQEEKLPNKKVSNMSVKSFGGENHFHTIKFNNSNSLIVEELLGQIEAKYTPIYRKLIDTEENTLTLDDKTALLKFLVSQALRVKTYHNVMNTMFDNIIDHSFYYFDRYKGERSIYFGDKETDKIDFSGKTIEEAKKDSHESTRKIVLTSIWSHISKLVLLLKNHEIIIWRNNHELGYISNDDPVRYSGTALYDPNNKWSISLDNKHKLCLIPPTSQSNPLEIFRGDITITPILDNFSAIEKRISFVFGNENDIYHSIEQKMEYDKNPKAYVKDIISNRIK